jgi:hypothetical protein
VGQEESAEADLRRVAEANKRSDVTQDESLEGGGRGFTDPTVTYLFGIAQMKPGFGMSANVDEVKERIGLFTTNRESDKY